MHVVGCCVAIEEQMKCSSLQSAGWWEKLGWVIKLMQPMPDAIHQREANMGARKYMGAWWVHGSTWVHGSLVRGIKQWL